MLHVDDSGYSAVSAKTAEEMSRDRILESEALSIPLTKADQRPAFVLGQLAWLDSTWRRPCWLVLAKIARDRADKLTGWTTTGSCLCLGTVRFTEVALNITSRKRRRTPQVTDWLEMKRMLMCKRTAGAWKGTSAQAVGYVLREEESWWPVPHNHKLTKVRNLRLYLQ